MTLYWRMNILSEEGDNAVQMISVSNEYANRNFKDSRKSWESRRAIQTKKSFIQDNLKVL